jgi:hypothetical protein
MKFKALQATGEVSKTPNNDLDADEESHLLKGEDEEHVAISVSPIKSIEDTENQAVSHIVLTQNELMSNINLSLFSELDTHLTPLIIADYSPRISQYSGEAKCVIQDQTSCTSSPDSGGAFGTPNTSCCEFSQHFNHLLNKKVLEALVYLACFLVYDQIVGLIVGAVTWLRNIMVGDGAPLRVIQDSIQLLGYMSFINFLKYNRLNITYIYIYITN